MLETEISKLQNEIEARANQSKPDLNTSPAPEYHHHHYQQQHPERVSQFPGLPIFQGPGFQQSATTLHPPATVLVLPIQPDPQTQDISEMTQAQQPLMFNSSNVSKPCPRYASAADSWSSRLLGERLKASE